MKKVHLSLLVIILLIFPSSRLLASEKTTPTTSEVCYCLPLPKSDCFCQPNDPKRHLLFKEEERKEIDELSESSNDKYSQRDEQSKINNKKFLCCSLQTKDTFVATVTIVLVLWIIWEQSVPRATKRALNNPSKRSLPRYLTTHWLGWAGGLSVAYALCYLPIGLYRKGDHHKRFTLLGILYGLGFSATLYILHAMIGWVVEGNVDQKWWVHIRCPFAFILFATVSYIGYSNHLVRNMLYWEFLLSKTKWYGVPLSFALDKDSKLKPNYHTHRLINICVLLIWTTYIIGRIILWQLPKKEKKKPEEV